MSRRTTQPKNRYLQLFALAGVSLVFLTLYYGTPAHEIVPESVNFFLPHPLTYAATTEDDAAVIELLRNGSDPNDRDDNYRTALMWCAHYGKPHLVEMLLDKGANPEAVDNKGQSVLHWANSGQTVNPQVIALLNQARTKWAQHE